MKLIGKEVNASMCIIFEGNLNEKIKDIVSLEGNGEIVVSKTIKVGSTFFKMQDKYYDGNGVFFNQTSENRFSLSDKSKGPQYLADSPHTACHELYQEEKFIDHSDFETNCMAVLKVERDLRVFDETRLAPHLGIAVGDLMGPKAAYPFTQELAKELSQHADGLEYLSRHTGKPCVVLWSDQIDGQGMLSTESVTPLKDFSHEGQTAKDILKSQCGIRIL
ncbi:RES family NAD+ phosphorylase (plasmid) [Aeromonas dhakensis]|uniref:RES family NAD+ phosphorylase n=1 Tax=Aeromonas dhakensis TaxID=196024 RepID=UPI002A8174B7|nr:RES family NAD+ phosphorylase [Aeromonas dhakensis]WPS59303.1 RES family NAD+ phosphorylase [Aeromonas dhakensis]